MVLLVSWSQTLEPATLKQSRAGKEAKKPKDPLGPPATDPLSSGDPLSLPPTSDPLSAALLDPLSLAAADSSGTGFGKSSREKVL